jgi:hypothetical protein
MSAADRTKRTAFFGMDSARTFTGHKIEDGPNGTKIIRGVEVFRTGTFRDSMGEQRTWSKKELRKMAENFTILRDADIFPDPPMRRDHSWSVDKVMGYITEVYMKGEKLVVDYQVVDPAEVDHLINGKYRKVSSEIGMYSDNDDNPYWPVLMGVAYVDIPAVQGLHSKSRDGEPNFFHFTETQEDTNVDPKDDKAPQRPSSFRIKGVDTNDHAAVQAYITELEARPVAASFRVNGAETLDAAAVQQHIDVLEGFRQEARDGNRAAFVKGLETDGKIVATQTEMLTELAKDMSDVQFEKFQASYKDAPKLGILANHGQTGKGGLPVEQAQAKDDEIAILEGQINQFRLVNMSDERIQATKAYKRLTALKNS